MKEVIILGMIIIGLVVCNVLALVHSNIWGILIMVLGSGWILEEFARPLLDKITGEDK